MRGERVLRRDPPVAAVGEAKGTGHRSVAESSPGQPARGDPMGRASDRPPRVGRRRAGRPRRAGARGARCSRGNRDRRPCPSPAPGCPDGQVTAGSAPFASALAERKPAVDHRPDTPPRSGSALKSPTTIVPPGAGPFVQPGNHRASLLRPVRPRPPARDAGGLRPSPAAAPARDRHRDAERRPLPAEVEPFSGAGDGERGLARARCCRTRAGRHTPRRIS